MCDLPFCFIYYASVLVSRYYQSLHMVGKITIHLNRYYVCLPVHSVVYFLHMLLKPSRLQRHGWPLPLLRPGKDELSTGHSGVLLKTLTFDLLLVMHHQDEFCIPCRSQKMNDRPVQGSRGAAIDLHFLFRAKGSGRWLGSMCYYFCLPRRSSGAPDSAPLCVLPSAPLTHACVRT